jgi:hypothetical protein
VCFCLYLKIIIYLIQKGLEKMTAKFKINNFLKQLILKISGILLVLFVISSCCDCPLDPVELQIKCIVREATITKFNPGMQKVNDTTFIPLPEYSIHSFLFPDNDSYSGILVNDDRFTGKEQITIASVSYSSGEPYQAAILDKFPLNPNLVGDFMVVDINTNGTTADLRFKGSLEKISNQFLSESATNFCDFIKNNQNEILNKSKDLKLYGKGVQGSFTNRNYSETDVDILDSRGIIITGQPGVPSPSQQDIASLLALTSDKAINIKAAIGDVLVYKAINGHIYVMSVVNINVGILDPFKKRVSIMFNKIS